MSDTKSTGRVFPSLLFAAAACAATLGGERAQAEGESVAPVLYQQSMNVFRRHEVESEKMFEFYGDVLGFEQLETFGAVSRFQVGASELKFTGRVGGKTYEPGSVADATGLRLVTFYFDDEAALTARFEAHGYEAPEFHALPDSGRKVALTRDPDGQPVELVVVPGASDETLQRMEVGLTVQDLEASRAFYGEFVGLEPLEPAEHPLLGATKYPYRHGSTTINLYSFGGELPADTGSGGIQYVVSNVDRVNELAAAEGVTIDQPLTDDPDAALRTVWLEDPDGITNYFAETTWSRGQSSTGGQVRR